MSGPVRDTDLDVDPGADPGTGPDVGPGPLDRIEAPAPPWLRPSPPPASPGPAAA
jgi:hypothetical protein